VKTKSHIIQRRRIRLRLGRSRLTVESETIVPNGWVQTSEQSVVAHERLARIIQARGQSLVPLLLHLGHKGLGRAMAQMSECGFVTRLSPLTSQRLQHLRIGHRALVGAGLLLDTWQMVKAIQRSFATKSTRPAAAQAARSLTTWGAIWAGVELFGTGGALLGIELGPGVVVTTAAGATVGGCVGLFAGDWIAKQIEAVGHGQAEFSA
jgi:hypothetical protein